MAINNLLFFNKKGHQLNLFWNGDFWEGRELLPQVSQDLFETENIFVVEKLLDVSLNPHYGIPHSFHPSVNNNPMGITATFVNGANSILLSAPISPDLMGASFFSDVMDGTILSISGTTITINNTSPVDTSYIPFSISAWRTRWETPYNIVDHDEIPQLVGSWRYGDNKIITSSDSSKLKKGYVIAGQGIPDGSRIVSVKPGLIEIDKTLYSNRSNIKCWSYRVEYENDVSDRLYQYSLIDDPSLDGPVIMNQTESFFRTDYIPGDYIVAPDFTSTSAITSSSLSVNIALNSDQESLIGRVLIIEDISDISLGTPITILRMELIGEVIGEDERLNSLLENFGQGFYKEDAHVLRGSDPAEPYPDYIQLNAKRKELLIQGSEIFPYLGSYKGLSNIIKFFGYQDLTIKEYWLNIKKTSTNSMVPLGMNNQVLTGMKATPHGQAILINSIHDDENSGKYKQVEVYGKYPDGTYGLKSSLEQIFPSTAYKKTPLFGLFYNINDLTGEEDQWGYPITKNDSLFSPEEVLIKLFGLKELLKNKYLPVSAKIIDITGEGVYFSVNQTRVWSDNLKIDEIRLGLDIKIAASPQIGYVEDLRAFGVRTSASLPQLPFVPGQEGNTNSSDFGNLNPVSPFNQNYHPNEVIPLINAISSYYSNGESFSNNLELGDGDYNGPGYIQFSNRTPYYLPAGFPTVLSTSSFNLSMDEVQTQWNNLDRNISTYSTIISGLENLPSYDGTISFGTISNNLTINLDFFSPISLALSPGLENSLIPVHGSDDAPGKVQLKLETSPNNYIVVEVQSYDNSSGIADTRVLYCMGSGQFSLWNVSLTNLFQKQTPIEYYNYSFCPDGAYSWDNLRFLSYYEIEWTISKTGPNPYHFQLRGHIKDYWQLPHILPYTGQYDIQCRVWNSANDISIGYFNRFIKVEPRAIELTSIARYREAETYTWDAMVKTWDDYNSPWISPIEQADNNNSSQSVLRPGYYGNNADNGQECRVLTPIPEIRASLEFNMGVVTHQIISISSSYRGGIVPAIVTTFTPHGLNPGDRVWIYDYSFPSVSGSYEVIEVITPNEIRIPLILSSDIILFGNYLSGPGSISISASGRAYSTINYSGDIGTMAGELYSSINSNFIDPHYTIESYEATSVSGLSSDILIFRIIIEAPQGSGSKFNGQIIDLSSTGSIILNNGDSFTHQLLSEPLSGGSDSSNAYLNYNPGDPLLIPALKDWGSKPINWDSFDTISWDELYSQSWSMYDYHQDWLGGFDLYNIRPGDLIQVGKKNPGVSILPNGSPALSLFLYDVAAQLNASSDPGVSKFSYNVRGYSHVHGKYDSEGNLLISEIIAPHITYSQSSVYSYDQPADYASMTNGSYNEITQTGTNGSSFEWVQMDLNQVHPIKTVVVGCDANNQLQYDWGASYTQNKDVQYSLDGITWNFLFNTGLFTQGIQEYSVDCSARFIRIISTTWLAVTEFYARIPLSTEIGPIEESTDLINLGVVFTPIAIARGNHGEIYLKSDSTGIYQFNSPTSIRKIRPSYSSSFIQVDRKNRVWAYGEGAIPLQIIEIDNEPNKIAFISQMGSPSGYREDIIIPIDFTSATISVLAIDDRKGDFAALITIASVGTLLYYDGTNGEFSQYDTSSGLPSIVIRQMQFDYKDGVKILWIATDSGISCFNGIEFFNYNSSNSGLFADNIFSICIDEIGNKWIGTDSGLTYYDGITWTVWNNLNTPVLPTSVDWTNIITSGHGNIFFVLRGDVRKLGYFNGDNFVIWTNEPGTNNTFYPYIPSGSYENNWMMLADTKVVDASYSQCPGDIFFIDEFGGLKRINYVIPHIHATSKYPGPSGWDFIYHSSNRSLPEAQNYEQGIGYSLIDFNYIAGPINGNDILGDQFSPKFPNCDAYSWKSPDWTGFDSSSITKNHPDLNPDHLFLDAPLRDILDRSALQEEYWRNPPIERSADRRKRELIDNFEWLIRLGDSFDDRGMSIEVGNDGFIYVTGYYQGHVSFGSPNTLNSGISTSLSSPDCRSIFVAKYHEAGVIQWVRSYGESNGSSAPYDYDFTPMSIKLDSLGNVNVVGYKTKTRNNIAWEQPSNLLIRWNWNGEFISATKLFESSIGIFNENFDVAIDKGNNFYIIGEFIGTLTSGDFSISSATSSTECYLTRIDSDGIIRDLIKMSSGLQEYNPSLAIGDYEDLYVTFSSWSSLESHIQIRSYNTNDLSMNWNRSIDQIGHPVILNPCMNLSFDGELIISFSFTESVRSGAFEISTNLIDISLWRFLTTGNLIAASSLGSTYGDTVYSVKTDNQGRIWILGAYSGAFFRESPDHITSPMGGLDILLLKLEKNGTIMDFVSLGSISDDAGIGLGIDHKDNVYITGYVSGALNTGKFITSPTYGGSKDCFIGKISQSEFIPGRSMDGPSSWAGTGSWSSGDKKIFDKEFEIPIGTTVFINPLDSNIPGKQAYQWRLSEQSTGAVIIDLKDPSYFIWNFKQPGYYNLDVQLKDSNGNEYSLSRPGFIRVIDHTAQFANGVVPHQITSNDFDAQSLYKI